MTKNLVEAALKYSQAGLSVIPTNKEKIPTLKEWSPYQKRIATKEEIKSWNMKTLSIIGGEVSGGLEFLDFDSMAEAYPEWAEIVKEQQPGLLEKLVRDKSPKGGHGIYRCTEVAIPGSMKLAQKGVEVPGEGIHKYKGKELQAKRYGDKWFIVPDLIETKGEGGYCLVCPSKGYELKQGDLLNISTITAEERDILVNAGLSCNQWFLPEEIQKGYTSKTNDGTLPGQDFDERGDLRGLLRQHGWAFKKNGGVASDGREREYWARPGKTKGWSATLTGNIFFNFSQNGQPFEYRTPYSPFAVFAYLEHNRNFSAAAKALAAQGYGNKPTEVNSKKGRMPRFLNVKAMEKEFGKEIEWLWRDLVPKGNPVVFAGREGQGKSTDVAQICKEIVLSNKKYWALWIGTEGFISDHADKWRKLKLPEQVVMLSDDKEVYKLQLDNYRDREFLDESIEALKRQTNGQVVAVVIDSIRGMQSMGENDPKIANLISSVNAIVCDKHKAACIYIAHHKKGKDDNRLNRVAGSTGITSSVRAVYAVERVSEFVCKIVPDKINILGHNPKTYKSVLIEDDDGGYDISFIEDTVQDDGTGRTRAEKLLISLFREKTEYLAAEIYKIGAIENLSSGVIKSAKANLPIETIHESPKSPWIWRCDLYKQKEVPCRKTGVEDNKKPNKINQGLQGLQNSGDTPKKATGATGATGDIEENSRYPVEKDNNNNNVSILNKEELETTREWEQIPKEGIPI